MGYNAGRKGSENGEEGRNQVLEGFAKLRSMILSERWRSLSAIPTEVLNLYCPGGSHV